MYQMATHCQTATWSGTGERKKYRGGHLKAKKKRGGAVNLGGQLQTIIPYTDRAYNANSVPFEQSKICILCQVSQGYNNQIRVVTCKICLSSPYFVNSMIRTLCKTAVVPIPTTAHRPFIELPWGDC